MVWRRAVTSAATVRLGNLIVHVNEISSLGSVLAELAKATPLTSTSCSFYGPQHQQFRYPLGSVTSFASPTSIFSPPSFVASAMDASAWLLNILNWKAGAPHNDLRPAMLACRQWLSPSSVSFINDLNDSLKFSRHLSGYKAFFMIRQILSELNSHGTFQSSGLSTLPPLKRQRIFPGTPPGVWSLADYVDPDILQWHEAAESDIVRTAEGELGTNACDEDGLNFSWYFSRRASPAASTWTTSRASDVRLPSTPPPSVRARSSSLWADLKDDSSVGGSDIDPFPTIFEKPVTALPQVPGFPNLEVGLPKGDDDDAECGANVVAPIDSPGVSIGNLVFLHGLARRADLNGLCGVPVSYHQKKARWQVKVSGQVDFVLLDESNLRSADPTVNDCRIHCTTCGNSFCGCFSGTGPTLLCPFHPEDAGIFDYKLQDLDPAAVAVDMPKASSSFSPSSSNAEALTPEPTRHAGHCLCIIVDDLSDRHPSDNDPDYDCDPAYYDDYDRFFPDDEDDHEAFEDLRTAREISSSEAKFSAGT